ncbi:MAG: dihydroorotate dehydrogenase [Gemmatimonadaceae bacterium]|nr:dihydroorotate dehydrogenase [Gemmatimonadaceae bacterium]
MQTARLRTTVCGLHFQNPILLAAGTAAYGRELDGVSDLNALGGIVTKAVSAEPRSGAPAPRVAEFEGGMINAVGLANPGVEKARAEDLPWLAANLKNTRVIVNIVGSRVEDFAEVVSKLEDTAVDAYELNVSCPNTKQGGTEFGADNSVVSDLVARVRAVTKRPLFVKLSPTLRDIGATAKTAIDAGGDAITVINTIPGMLIDTETRKPQLGFGTGGVSGPGLLPVGLLATWKVRKAVTSPVLGVGGITSAQDVLQYFLAGASLVAVGTAALRDPRLPARIVRDLEAWCSAHGVIKLSDITGELQWQ